MRLRADGGKYAPASAWTVLQHNRRARSPADKIPMRGLIIGDGWCDLHHEKMGTYVFDPYSGPHGCSFQTCGGRPVYKLEGGFSASESAS